MIHSLKNHPFAVEAFFESSIVLTFAVDKSQLLDFIPNCLELDTFEDKWAFIAVAIVQTKDLRPKNFPTFLGHDFILVGYRIFVRYKNENGKKLRGLYILKSETKKLTIELLGNLFTHYNYTTTDLSLVRQANQTIIKSHRSKFHVNVYNQKKDVPLPADSPFSDWKAARRFAGPLPFTFSFNPVNNSVLIVEGVRDNWKPTPIYIKNYHFNYLNSLNFQNIVLANAFEIKNAPYYWKKGIIEKWK